VAIFFGFTLGCICWSIHPGKSVIFLLLPILIIPFIIGLLDDLIHLKPLAKLIGQAITASLLFAILDIRLTSDYGLFGGVGFPAAGSYAVTLVTVIVITNSLNLIDGIDGLAATFSFIACICFGAWFFFVGNYPFSILCLALAGGILAFLFKNWEPSNIFMGDTGSLVIGTVLSVITIQFINENFSLGADHPMKFNSSVVTAMCVMILPLVDTMRIIIIRLSKGISPFTADKRHIHHGLVRIGLSHRRAVSILAVVHILVIAIAILLKNSAEWTLMSVVLLISTALCLALDQLIARSVPREMP
jgi:UDP-N-acetylmuramyl pentapeptide phosphotransferase/UDP-N-acetylglucosamine-1-phosphate transferase